MNNKKICKSDTGDKIRINKASGDAVKISNMHISRNIKLQQIRALLKYLIGLPRRKSMGYKN